MLWVKKNCFTYLNVALEIQEWINQSSDMETMKSHLRVPPGICPN